MSRRPSSPRTGSPHDGLLLENVFPGDWQNPEPRGRYDLVVVGAGSAGLISAALAAGLGARVARVEEQHRGTKSELLEVEHSGANIIINDNNHFTFSV